MSFFDFVLANLDKEWDWSLLSKNPNITWNNIQKHPELEWKWSEISGNPNITWKIVQENPDKPWDWSVLSRNPIITWEIVCANPDIPWDWYYLSSNPNITLNIFQENPNKPWSWIRMSSNPNVSSDFILNNLNTLRMVAKKINENVLYIPYNRERDWKDRSVESYADGLNHSAIDSVQMKIDFSVPQTTIGVYGIFCNEFICRNGLGGLRFGYNGTIHLLDNWERLNMPGVGLPMTKPAIEWVKSVKPVPEGKTFCPIAHDDIQEGNEYCECSHCHNCFFAEGIKSMFETMKRECPLCRTAWTNWVIYKNSVI
jgi:hypothetical protein